MAYSRKEHNFRCLEGPRRLKPVFIINLKNHKVMFIPARIGSFERMHEWPQIRTTVRF